MRKLLLFLSIWLGGLAVATAQTKQVTGKVTDNSGAPVPYATVQVKGSKVTSIADADGNFAIRAAAGDILVITSSGITRKEAPVQSAVSGWNIVVTRVSQNLSEVVVTTALGIRRQARDLGYATTQIKSAQLNQAAVVNPATGLAAKVSGVDIRLADNGVNPQVKVTFRGSRSIEGDNAALVVVDGVPVDQTYLPNVNPADIQDVTVLKGSNAAALYGMAASNGVMVITTKKAKGKFSLNYSNTFSLESISYFPKFQSEYSGYGGEPAGAWPNPPGGAGSLTYYVNPFTGLPNTVPFENEDYGNAYNSNDFHPDSIPIGISANGTWINIPYRAAPNGRKDFFQTGIGDQNKLSASMANSWGGLYISGEHTTKQGVVPKDTYSRSGGRINGNLNFGRFSASGGVSYNNSTTDIAGSSYNQYRPVYYDVLNQLPSTDLKSIKNINLLQNNQGFVNAYFPNPWWQVDNSRAKNSTDQLVSNLQLNYKLTGWLSITARGGYSRSSTNAPAYIDSINFPALITNLSPGTFQWGTSSYNPGPQGYQSELIKDHYWDANGDAFLTFTKEVSQFKFTVLAGGNYRERSSYGYWYSNQVNEGPYLGQNFIPSGFTKVATPTTANPGAAYAIYTYKRYDQSVYADATVGYDNWVFLHGSFRNDWTSILDPHNRSFSYPSVDASAVLSDKIEALKSGSISFLKVRVGYAGTGNVSLDGYKPLGVMGNVAAGTAVGGFSAQIPNYGAYSIYPITTTGAGFPYGAGASSYTQSFTAVQNGLKPEHTQSLETGFELGLFKNRINLEATYYNQVSNNQTIPLQTSQASGISTYVTNAGKINNSGVELDLHLTPLIRAGAFRFDLDMNFAYQNSKVVNIAGGSALLDQINYGTTSLGGIYAIAGKSYPQILATDFYRDPKGHIIVDGTTGLPSINPNPVDEGQANYKYFFGTSPHFSYKGITLSAVFDYRGGAKILNEEGNVFDFAGASPSDAANRQAFIVPNSVINTGTAGKPSYAANNNVPITSLNGNTSAALYWWTLTYSGIGAPYVTSAAFIKLREISLNYEFPKQWLGTQQVIRDLNVSLIGRNLFMWRPKTNIWSDPEFSTNATGNAVGYTTEFQTPPTRIISATISATIF
jgi:TonB-linked SusC/RagA family outer membrane protein